MFYDFIYLAKGFRMRPKVRSTLNPSLFALWFNVPVNNYGMSRRSVNLYCFPVQD